MIYQNIKTYYISDDKGNSDNRLVRYDIIAIDDYTYQVKIFDVQKSGPSLPYSIVMIDEFEFTRDEYRQRHNIGKINVILRDMPPTFDRDLLVRCQEHRNSIQ